MDTLKDFLEKGGELIPIGSHMGKIVVIASDHRGFDLKAKIISYFEKNEYTVIKEISQIKEDIALAKNYIIDLGVHNKDRADYPAISATLGNIISNNYPYVVGIGICGSGIGIGEVAVKHRRVYAARCTNPKEAGTSRMHNNSNLLTIGADYTDTETAILTVDKWMKTRFYSGKDSEESYLNRYIQKIRLEDEAC